MLVDNGFSRNRGTDMKLHNCIFCSTGIDSLTPFKRVEDNFAHPECYWHFSFKKEKDKNLSLALQIEGLTEQLYNVQK